MTDLRQAAQQALEALEKGATVSAAITLRAALAEPDIDPVDEYRKGFIDGQIDMRDRPEEQPEPVQQAEQACKCNLRTRLVGDGCEVCNPELAAELAQPPEPAQEQGPVAAAFGAEQHPTDDRVVIERRGETLYLNGQEIGPGTLEIRRDGTTYRSAEPQHKPTPLNEGRLWQHSDGSIGVGTPAEPAQDWKSLPDLMRVLTPPQRKPLTEEEIDALFYDWNSHCYGGPVESHRRFARAVERKVRGETE